MVSKQGPVAAQGIQVLAGGLASVHTASPMGSAICGVGADGYHLQGCSFSLNLLFYDLDTWCKLSVAWLGCYLFALLHS